MQTDSSKVPSLLSESERCGSQSQPGRYRKEKPPISTAIQIPDRPARTYSLYRRPYLASVYKNRKKYIIFIIYIYTRKAKLKQNVFSVS